ncbi:hypothetical protein PoB_000346900 [Plakobranchus ocellatus]|uniref:Uncharacterized protein n=1 Tax=Plakobranchus ocellatus TaxID=259542 RepID=A0AAV3Y202_9GAST|nr:hypothetical protein PoB_000346900 [Plakobranchus ocellatus]
MSQNGTLRDSSSNLCGHRGNFIGRHKLCSAEQNKSEKVKNVRNRRVYWAVGYHDRGPSFKPPFRVKYIFHCSSVSTQALNGKLGLFRLGESKGCEVWRGVLKSWIMSTNDCSSVSTLLYVSYIGFDFDRSW